MKCELCDSDESDQVQYGKFYIEHCKAVHMNCLLLSTGLQRRGYSGTSINGFLLSDIEKQRQLASKNKCCYCDKRGANISCWRVNCERWFHLVCGVKNGARNQFIAPYRSYCNRHIKKPTYRPKPNEICCICYENLFTEMNRFNAVDMLRAPCCRNGWFHKFCLQKYAQTAGNSFKCPLCNNVERFGSCLPYWGVAIYNTIPEWELTSNAPENVYERNFVCDALRCINPLGRTHHTGSNPIYTCTICGNVTQHFLCARYSDSPFACDFCILGGRLTRESSEESIFDDYINPGYQNSSYNNSRESTNSTSKGLHWFIRIADNVLCHPFIVLRRQCQIYNASRRYHLQPFSLVPIIMQLYRRKDVITFWNGLGECLICRCFSWVFDKIFYFFIEKENFFCYLLVKSMNVAVMFLFNAGCLVATVAGSDGLLFPQRLLPLLSIYVPCLCMEIAKDIFGAFIRNRVWAIMRKSNQQVCRREYDGVENQKAEICTNLITRIITEVVFYPFETVLSRIQIQGTKSIIDNLDNGKTKVLIQTDYKGAADCYRTIVKNEGFSGLYKGFGALTLQFAAHIVIVKIANWIF
ncbi:solute carrier family 25 member 46-like [Anastrepha ludens]|uniref:solute carrier family 25 member 46-like n=1 Tax=Anastrepha ludens TaxID=28586 RepID=UPI0023AE8D85|nr:solute carrier family 25 member 46-like [Anastrepha ludens]